MTAPDFDHLPELEAARTSLDALVGRVEADPDRVEKGLAQLVLSLVELLRQLMERQAIRRVEAGGLEEDQIERLGTTLMLLERRMGELRETFGLTEEDLSLDLGPLGRTV
ncbi:MAG TPA: gas vesicle protein K [Candidatus Eisenbacteria bacterium]|nr:gas vesicle protein K [Candidatus Eisenbacteria bacterium]